MSERAPKSSVNVESATSTESVPSRSEVLESFSQQTADLQQKLEDVEGRAGFNLDAIGIMDKRNETKSTQEQIDAINAEWATIGGSEVDEAQAAVDALNFKSSATDRIYAQKRLQAAKDAVYENFLTSNDELAEQPASQAEASASSRPTTEAPVQSNEEVAPTAEGADSPDLGKVQQGKKNPEADANVPEMSFQELLDKRYLMANQGLDAAIVGGMTNEQVANYNLVERSPDSGEPASDADEKAPKTDEEKSKKLEYSESDIVEFGGRQWEVIEKIIDDKSGDIRLHLFHRDAKGHIDHATVDQGDVVPDGSESDSASDTKLASKIAGKKDAMKRAGLDEEYVDGLTPEQVRAYNLVLPENLAGANAGKNKTVDAGIDDDVEALQNVNTGDIDDDVETLENVNTDGIDDDVEALQNVNTDDADTFVSTGRKIRNELNRFKDSPLMYLRMRLGDIGTAAKNFAAEKLNTREAVIAAGIGTTAVASVALWLHMNGTESNVSEAAQAAGEGIGNKGATPENAANIIKEAMGEAETAVDQATTVAAGALEDAKEAYSDASGSELLSNEETLDLEAAGRVDAGEGWNQTMAELGIPEAEWDGILDKVGPALGEMTYPDQPDLRIAYFDIYEDEWRINLPESGKMPREALDLIQEARNN